jgi:hypothetical protein
VVGVDGQLSAEHLMTWRHQGQEVPIFIQYNGYPPHVDEQYKVGTRCLLVKKCFVVD